MEAVQRWSSLISSIRVHILPLMPLVIIANLSKPGRRIIAKPRHSSRVLSPSCVAQRFRIAHQPRQTLPCGRANPGDQSCDVFRCIDITNRDGGPDVSVTGCIQIEQMVRRLRKTITGQGIPIGMHQLLDLLQILYFQPSIVHLLLGSSIFRTIHVPFIACRFGGRELFCRLGPLRLKTYLIRLTARVHGDAIQVADSLWMLSNDLILLILGERVPPGTHLCGRPTLLRQIRQPCDSLADVSEH